MLVKATIALVGVILSVHSAFVRADDTNIRLLRESSQIDINTNPSPNNRPVAQSVSDNHWRYAFHNNHWWYWQPNNTWVIAHNDAWVPYSAETYRNYYPQNDVRLNYGRTKNMSDPYTNLGNGYQNYHPNGIGAGYGAGGYNNYGYRNGAGVGGVGVGVSGVGGVDRGGVGGVGGAKAGGVGGVDRGGAGGRGRR
jgi:hypothetical protein